MEGIDNAPSALNGTYATSLSDIESILETLTTMKNHLLRVIVLSFVLCLTSFVSKAQWVSIPDTAFGHWLSYDYSACMQGNSIIGWQMDTTCPAIVNAVVLLMPIGDMRDLTGVQYFDNLQTFRCGYLELTQLPPLPPRLVSFDCSVNNLTSLPPLPKTLQQLNIMRDSFTVLPTLPAGLRSLNCGYNKLTALPTLPDSLVQLSCEQNHIVVLPVLPDSLRQLVCEHNNLTVLPALPDSLNYISCDYNHLTTLPALPARMDWVSCTYNQITALPVLPPNLTHFYCGNNLLTALPAIPPKVWILECAYNQLTSLPSLPTNIHYPYSFNLLCNNNLLTSLPELDDTLGYCHIQNNPISCFPKVLRINDFKFSNTNIACFPNHINIDWNGGSVPSPDSFPICDIFNANGCPVYWNISGKCYADINANCLNDGSDNPYQHIKVSLLSGGTIVQQVFTDNFGFYSFDTDSFGTYTVTVDTAGIASYVSCPSNNTLTSTLTAFDSLDYNMDFGLTCKPGFDLAVQTIYHDPFLVGNFSTVNISAGDAANYNGVYCTTGVSGAVTVTISGPVSYISPAIGALTPTVSGNTLTYNIADFGNVHFATDFNIVLFTDTTALFGSQACITVSVTPSVGDNNPSNNSVTQCFEILLSCDPNEKEVYPAGNIDTTQNWLTYTVRFQNTGTAPAQRIYVADTLDAHVDVNSFKLLAFSHEPVVQIKGNAVRFNFANINLPDSNANEPASHGFVQYKVKLKTNLALGTQIKNTAFIYFDYNAAVVTNTTTNTLSTYTGMAEVRNQMSEIRLNPNPAKGSVIVSLDESLIGSLLTVYDITGKKMITVQSAPISNQLSIRDFASGVYLVVVTSANGNRTMKKLVVE